MDAEEYLCRIGCAGQMMPTLETLNHLHRSHLLSVPFENLTIHSGGQIRLELTFLYDKIVRQRRGGFCYENNGLFSWLLSQLGYKVSLLSAQVKNRITGVYGPPFDHLVIMVTLDGKRWLCDVGFGSGFEVPMSLDTEDPHEQEHGIFRIRSNGMTMFLEMVEDDNSEDKGGQDGCWRALYKFTLQPRQREDFLAMCIYHQTSPSSVFYCKSLCSLLLPNGRVTYMGRKLIVTSFPSEQGGPATKTAQEVCDEDIPKLLKERFGIQLPSPLVPKDDVIVPPPPIY